ncbi:MAG TPA: tRNA uridine-5-carboxymethylaminomethyl(34) synthesis GTPase MnmE, partial [Fusobacteria bacterium]|nr:tRNA uridine-5-carboxymethylaminomethyl(34) synthesis GTPase MnmE [Fusobacteriota bacterium]
MDDTIVGISSSGAISILRLSGSKSLEIVSELLSSKNKLKDREICYGKIVDKGVEIDEVLVAFMKSPKSYTKEDVVEIYCHGNRIIAQKIMNSLVDRGAKIADRGEFTKRAFLNGRIDLTQA